MAVRTTERSRLRVLGTLARHARSITSGVRLDILLQLV